MALFSFRRNHTDSKASAAPAYSVEELRRRAKHRLIGAVVLVLAAVIGFPLLFDSQPRPVVVDIPIVIPDRNKVTPMEIPAAPAGVAASPVASAPVASMPVTSAEPVAPKAAAKDLGAAAPAPKPSLTREVSGTIEGATAAVAAVAVAPAVVKAITPTTKPEPSAAPKPTPALTEKPLPAVKAEAKAVATTAPAPAPVAKPEPKPGPKADTKPVPKTEAKPAPKVETKADAKPETKTESKADAHRAQALLEGKEPPKPAADDHRFVVQVGAFADTAKARDVRQTLEKAGLHSYTQVANTADGPRVRVRLGPYATKAEADKAAARAKSLNLGASVLAL